MAIFIVISFHMLYLQLIILLSGFANISFLLHDAISVVLAVIMCPSVCLSVHLSHTGILSKQRSIGSCKHHRTIARGL